LSRAAKGRKGKPAAEQFRSALREHRGPPAFLQDIATLLHGCVEIGPGVVHRICAEVQCRHFDAPDLGHVVGAQSKYR
jgi:hypothetical protein